MKKSSATPVIFGSSVAVGLALVLTTRPAMTQVNGAVPGFVRLQSTTPGTAQTGNSNITGSAVSAQVSVGSGPVDASLKVNNNIAGIGFNANNLLYTNTSLGFVGVGRTTRVTGAESFGVYALGTGSAFGGMYVQTQLSTMRPFYGYSAGGAISAYHYFDPSISSWALNVGGVSSLFVNSDGQVGIGAAPTQPLDISLGTYKLQITSSNGGVPTIDSAGAGASVGQLRLRNLISVFPNAAGTQAGKFDVRDTAGLARITLDGAGGSSSFDGTMNLGADLRVRGEIVVDSANQNVGTNQYNLKFGNASGEAIGSARSVGANLGGLDFYTASNPRMSILNDGRVGVANQTPTSQFDIRAASNNLATNGFSVSNSTGQQRIHGAVDVANAGYITVFGANNSANSLMSYLSGFPANGYMGVYDTNNFIQAAMYVESNNLGNIFADVKNFKVPSPRDEKVDYWYASLEGPEAGMYTRGKGHLVNGRAHIEFPDHFTDMAVLESMTVVLTPASFGSKGLAYANLTMTGFDVGELSQGRGNYSFDWEVKSVRKGHEDYKVVRPWDEVIPGGQSRDEAWAARLRMLQSRSKKQSRP